MLSFPNIKINIGLYVTGKRADGFHDLESIFYSVPMTDALEIVASKEFSFETYGSPPTHHIEDDLCVKAYRLLQKDYDIPPIKMALLKKIPTGAGLGGGSADASFCLKMLNTLFELNISTEKLEEYAAILGSDCPFFIRNVPAYVSGRGENLIPIHLILKGLKIVIVFPGIHISTKEAFSKIAIAPPTIDLKELDNLPIADWKDGITNVFEGYAFGAYPAIKAIKESLYQSGALYASMSGSGSAVYGLFEADAKVNIESYETWQGML